MHYFIYVIVIIIRMKCSILSKYPINTIKKRNMNERTKRTIEREREREKEKKKGIAIHYIILLLHLIPQLVLLLPPFIFIINIFFGSD